MGLLNAQVARYNGASLVALIDINPSRLERAKNDFGFEHVATNLDDLRTIAPRGFDNVIEATGVDRRSPKRQSTRSSGAASSARRLSTGRKASYDAFKIYNEEISILGTMAVLNSYGPAIDILNSGAIDTERMVSDTYTLDQFPEAVAHVRAGKGMKVQVAGTSD